MADRDDAIVRGIECGTPQYVLAERHGISRQWVSLIWRRHLAGFKDETAPVRYWRDLIMLARAPNVGEKTMTEYYELLAREETKP
jgi:hypothetical protein